MQASKKRTNIHTLVLVAVMAALVFVLSKLEIPIPIGMDKTRIHLGNVMCLLSGVLFGPLVGGLAAGLGSMVYDLTNPLYVSEFWITFLMKFAMGFLAGVVAKHLPQRMKSIPRALVAALAGQVAYILLYLGKTTVMQHFVYGIPWDGTFVVVVGKGVVSGINGLLAVLCCTLLAPPLRSALDTAGLFKQSR